MRLMPIKVGRGVDLNVIKTLENMVHPNLKPDLTLLLDAPLDVCANSKLSKIQGSL